MADTVRRESSQQLNKQKMESENIKTIEAEIKAAQKRVEAAKKSGELKALDAYIKKYLEEKGQRIANQTAVDGKPLSDGEIALVKALRKTWGFAEILKPGDAVVVSKNKNGVYESTTHNISLLLIDGEGSDAEIVEALGLINEEHKIDNERALRALKIKAGRGCRYEAE
jgi:thioesterase domain-containing protein